MVASVMMPPDAAAACSTTNAHFSGKLALFMSYLYATHHFSRCRRHHLQPTARTTSSAFGLNISILTSAGRREVVSNAWPCGKQEERHAESDSLACDHFHFGGNKATTIATK